MKLILIAAWEAFLTLITAAIDSTVAFFLPSHAHSHTHSALDQRQQQLLLQRATEAQRSLARDKDKPTNRLNHTAQQRRLTHLKQLYKHGTESPNGKLSSSTPGQRGVSQGTTRCTDNDLRRSAGASQGHDPSSLHGVIPGETEAGKLDAEWLALDEAVDLYIWSQTLPASGDLLDDL